uniref:Dynein axonemal intermediate chain 3 n=1 Tax=Acanthochromis polyacanthus TaxID=80966 RepID=A0A3Q1G0I3_9TELE
MAPKRPKSGRSSHPDEIFPLVLTSATQELFGCRTDEDVTRESPYKLLKKDNIIQDIKTRAAVSDFSPVKQIVLDYPEEEMLLVFDRSFTYGQCFYLVLTPEAKDRILSPPEPETPEAFESEVSKTPQPKLWISLGSEQEIDEESVTETREKLCYKFSRVRRKFGVPVCFSDRNTAAAKDSYLECASYQDSRFSIKQMQRDCGTQAVPRLQSSSAQTQWYKNICTQYYPRELHEEDIDSTVQAESLTNLFNSVTPRVLQALQQEEIMNVFLDDCKALGTLAETDDWSGKVSEDLVLHYAFTNQKYTKDKKISSINWHPTIFGKVSSVIAVALTDKKKVQLDESSASIGIVFYSFSDPSNPQLLLECPCDLSAFEFNPSNPNIIVGGCVTGQVFIFSSDRDDNKENNTPAACYCAVSALQSSRKDPITDVQWLPQTFEVQGSLSGRQQNVDQKTPITPDSVPATFKHLDQTWKPLLRVRQCLGFAIQNSRLNHDFKCTTNFTLKFCNVVLFLFFCRQDGEIVYTDWKLEKDESGRLHSAKPLSCFRTHQGLVNTIQRSPFFKDIILTSGGWNFAIWKEGFMDGPIVMSPSSEQQYTAGCWSLSRPAVFFIGKEDGSIEVWNLLESTSEPAHIHAHITSAKITCVKPWTVSREFLASTAIYVWSVSEGIARFSFLGFVSHTKTTYFHYRLKQEPDKPVKLQHENREENMKEYSHYLTLEENVLKGLGL